MAIHDMEADWQALSSNCTFPSYVSLVKEAREASAQANEKLEQANVEFYTRADVYRVLCDVDEKKLAKDALEQRLLAKLKRDFERNGMHLEGAAKDRFVAIKKRLAEVCIKFQTNLNEDTTSVAFDRDELEGLPEDFVSSLTQKDGKFIVTLKYPEILPVMRYARRESTRRAMDKANGTHCVTENAPLLEEAVALRHELGQLMGCKTFAEFELQEKMAKTPEAVHKFLTELTARLRAKAEKELESLRALKERECKEQGREFDGAIRAWDTQYYLRMHTEEEYKIDDQAIKPYFPMQHVTDALLEMYQSILGLRFQEVPASEAGVWHPDVRMFAVRDAASGDFMGAFYLDLYPRDGKYTHAAAFPLQPTCMLRGARQYPISAMVANFTKPTADRPSLLKHDEVVTYFHEFGHVMHGICSESRFSRFAGTAVERDFVEAPSQMKENWCWERDVLRRISRHYQSGEPLPDALIERMIAAKNAHSGMMNLRQIFFGTYDMTIHTMPSVNTAEVWARLRPEVSLIPETPGNNPAASFGHLVGGYEAGYYGYLWSQVFSADMYTRFQKEGITSPTVGLEYRRKILARGHTMDGLDMVKDFLGREPTQDAFLHSIGAQ